MVIELNGSKPIPKRSKLEHSISILILTIIFVIGTGILYKQSRYDLKKYGLILEKETVPTSTETVEKINTDTIAPAGFSTLSIPFEYDSQTLYEKINGKAPLYLSSGFKSLTTRRYMNDGNAKLWFEIYLYDMGTLRNAFSVYSRQIRADEALKENILYNYTTDNAEIMVIDHYYIEIIGSKASPVIKKGGAVAAMNIRAQIGPMEEIPELILLKDPDLVKGSEKYYIKGAFGFDGFENIFSAKYRFKGERITAFILGPFSEERIEKAIKSYRTFLLNEGSLVKENNSSVPGLRILDFDGYFETMFKCGEYMAGVHESDSEEQALGLSKKFFGIIQRNIGEKNQ